VYTYIKREPKGSQCDGVRFQIPRAVEGKSEYNGSEEEKCHRQREQWREIHE